MSSDSSSKQYHFSELLTNVSITDEIFRLDFAWAGPAPAAGQFFMIRPKRYSVFLARPVSVYRWEPGSPGVSSEASGRLSFLIAPRGRGTVELKALQSGEEAALTGPLGNRWADFANPENRIEHGTKFHAVNDDGAAKPIALIGGGIGVAPLTAYAAELPQGSYDFYAGFRSASFGLEGIAPRSLIIASEDGGEGLKGRIPDFLDAAKYRAVYACGPEPMLRASAALCKAAGVFCVISMERRMACGAGACLGCTVATVKGNRRCCADGPVFNAEEALFE
jgi:NAD(P)H-flavin reductase